MRATIFTIGHATRTIPEFAALLQEAGALTHQSAILDELERLADAHRCAIMCAEAVWWRCHRRIVADHLLSDGFDVRHIMGPGKIEPASLTPGARRQDNGTLVYPAVPLQN